MQCNAIQNNTKPLTVSLQSRGSSPLSPFLDHLGSPPPAHMAGLRPGSLYPLPPQYGAAYTSLGMEQLAAWHQATIYQQGVRAPSPYSLPLTSSSPLTPPHIPRYSLPHHHPGLAFPHLSHHHLPHVKSDFDRPPGLMHPDDKVSLDQSVSQSVRISLLLLCLWSRFIYLSELYSSLFWEIFCQ